MSPTSQQIIPKLRFPEFSGSWEEKRLGEVCERIMDWTHFSPKSVEWKKMYITSKNIRNTWLDLTNCNYISQEEHEVIYKRCPVKFWDVLLTKDWANTGNCCINSLREEFSLLSSVAVLIGKEWVLYNIFLLQILQSDKWVWKITDRMAGQAISRITLDKIKKFKFLFPSFSEQTKIASFLSTVDEKIQQLTDLKSERENYKTGMMQQIFRQQIRFRDENGNDFPEWEKKKLGEFLIQKSTRNKDYKINLVLSVNNKKWFVTQNEQFDGHQVASKDLINYKIVSKWDFAYNPSRINVGSIARLINFECGIVSPMYVVFMLKEWLNNIYFENLYSTHRFKHLIKIGCSWSVRDSLNFEDMAGFNISVPSLPEQDKIANFLVQIDVKITEYTYQIEQTKQWKKWLLQGLFI